LNSNDISELCGKLKVSPLFQLSHSSKELFHSNFLAWCLNTWPEKAWGAFCSLVPPLKGTTIKPDKYVSRESNHHDLEIDVSGNGVSRVIVEVKTKSTPSLEQLEKYAIGAKAKVPPQTILLVLLSPYQPDFFPSTKEIKLDNGGVRCVWVPLAELGRILAAQIGQEKPGKDIYGYTPCSLSDLLMDYAFMSKGLSDVLSLTRLESDSEWLLPEEAKTHLQDAGLTDLVEKARADALCTMVEKKGPVKGPGNIDIDIIRGKGAVSPAGTIVAGPGMTRGTGIVEVDYVIRGKEAPSGKYMVVGVQLQDRQYRKFILVNGADRPWMENFCTRLADMNIWFDVTDDKMNKICQPAKNTRKNFCFYNGGFMHKYGHLHPKTTAEDIAQAMVAHVKEAGDKADAILAELNELEKEKEPATT
jgi:hypothetical protein